jgi:tetratricopeptide (TPR) repeat protein
MSERDRDFSEAVAAAQAASTFPELAEALRLLCASCGDPSYQSLAKKTAKTTGSISVSNMSEVLRPANPKPLTYSFVSKFANALEVGPPVVGEFEKAWQRVKREEVRRGNGQAAPVPEQRSTESSAPGIRPEHMKTLDYFADLADGLDGEQSLELAQLIHEHIHNVCQRLLGDDAERTETAARDLGVVLLARGEYARAYEFLWNDLKATTARYGPDHPHTLAATEHMAALHLHRGSYRDAIRLARQALANRRSQDAEADADALQYAAGLLIEALEKSGDREEAGRIHRQLTADLERLDNGTA